MRNETTAFSSIFAEDIHNYLHEKVLLGNKITSYIYPLKLFDTFVNEKNLKENILTKELMYTWLKLRNGEKRTNQSHRASILRGFSKYMNMINDKNYVLPQKLYSCGDKYNAHIYSKDELDLIFYKIDNLVEEQPNKQLKNRSSQIIFRLLYMCGLRISEALNIKIKDFDKEQKLLIIRHAKKDKDRLVPLNNKLNALIIDYINEFHILSTDESFLFKGKNNLPFTRFTINKRLKTILNLCKIEYNGQTLHSFRHTFCVHCLRKWAMEGKDLMVYLPILKTFLGHESFRETAYYLKLTADVYPNITHVLEKQYNYLIPKLEEES